MYDELIKNLRLCSQCDFGQNCNECTQERTDKFCCDELMHRAADAIEDLKKCLAIALLGYQRANNKWHMTEEYTKQKLQWIPVTERLPKENGFYLCLYKHKASGGVAMDEGLSILQWINNKWGINDIYLVTHWMPLPEPPKGET